MHHGFSSSHFKGPTFLFLSSHGHSLVSPRAHTGGHLASLIWWATPSREPSSSHWACFRFAGKSGWEKEAAQTRPQGQQEWWVLCGLTKAWVTRDLSVPFLGKDSCLCMEFGPSDKTLIKKEQWWPQVILSRLLSPELLSCMPFS